MKRLLGAAGGASLMLAAVVAAGETQILACAPKEKEAVGPQDKLECEAATGPRFAQTLGGLYADGWHLVSTGFFSGNRELLYLERAPAAEHPAPGIDGVKPP